METLGGRALWVRSELRLQQQEIADKLGISLRAWQKMERNEGVPSGETLLQFRKIGINPGWVLSGQGPRRDDAEAPVTDAVDVVLLQRLGDVVQATFADVKQSPPTRAITAETGRLYNELLQMVADVRDVEVVDAMIPVLRARFKKRLEEAAATPGGGKRSAS
ncbi:helix-turn-helix domain-containing protein [Shinella sp. BYT-45]|uniref:helix-turn-helix domain-containing protein n=1 Tax=Shinella sp. BYT-45 TaxID=3377377 RepID=UPI003981595B